MLPDNEKIRVLIVDDSAVMRGLWSRVLSSETFIVVVATAPNGAVATDFLQHNEVDVVILDLEMPVMDGMTAIPLMLKTNSNLKIIVASSSAIKGSCKTVEALTLGAFDFVEKPAALSYSNAVAQVADELIKKIKSTLATRIISPKSAPVPQQLQKSNVNNLPAKMIVIGASTGGPNALSDLIRNLPLNMEQPILIVQHMPPKFTGLLADRFATETNRYCAEAQHGQDIEPGKIYVAPGGFHMSIERKGATHRIVLDDVGAPENYCRPAVDVLFRSAAQYFGPELLAF